MPEDLPEDLPESSTATLVAAAERQDRGSIEPQLARHLPAYRTLYTLGLDLEMRETMQRVAAAFDQLPARGILL